MEYTTPVTTAFDVQRATIENSQRTLEHTVEFQRRVNEAVVDSLDSQESAQRRAVELSQSAFHSYLDAVEATVPGTDATVEEIRTAVDEQFEFLLDNHAEAFESVAAEYGNGAEAYDELTGDYLEALDEQVDLLVEAHEELETQSVETAEEWGDQLEELRAQVDRIQAQVSEVQEQATDAVDVDIDSVDTDAEE